MNTFRIFAEGRLDDELRGRLLYITQVLQGESPEYLLNVNEAEYIAHLSDRYAFEPLVIHFDRIEVSSEERYVEAHDYFQSRAGVKCRKQVITYHLPFTGDATLLRYHPNPSLAWSSPVEIEGGCVCFELIDYTEVPDDIRTKADGIISKIRQQGESVSKQVESFNAGLENAIREAFTERKKELLSKRQVLTSLGIPIRKSKQVPPTFAIPTVRKKVLAKPAVSPTVGRIVPTVDPVIYEDILQTIFDMGKTFERLPSTYAGKDETTLRDHLIRQLEPRFEGSTTGETFNKSGKTDILIRHEKSNVFVAECKFWGGKSMHFKTIDQLLSHLTWRDSKTAIVYFVNRREIVPVLREISETTRQHPCYIQDGVKRENGSWQAFEFHLPNDSDCKIALTVLAFHTPSAAWSSNGTEAYV